MDFLIFFLKFVICSLIYESLSIAVQYYLWKRAQKKLAQKQLKEYNDTIEILEKVYGLPKDKKTWN